MEPRNINSKTPKPDEVLFMGIKPKEMEAFPTHLVYSGASRVLSPPECNELIKIAESKTLDYGSVGNGHNHGYRDDPEYRSVSVTGLYPEDTGPEGQDLKWLYAKVAQRIVWANEQYRFHLSGFYESFQFLKYEYQNKDNRPPGHYKMHQDFGGGYSSLRKLSVVIQLSDPSEYDGCRLHLITHEDKEIQEIGQGDMIIFPSWTPHYVTPITKGMRYAMAMWVTGPQFC